MESLNSNSMYRYSKQRVTIIILSSKKIGSVILLSACACSVRCFDAEINIGEPSSNSHLILFSFA